ncbi:MAG: hypothetical protein WC943_16530, partial [Elusimicrobiota bacterium]
MPAKNPDFFPLIAGSVLEYEVDRGGAIDRRVVETLSVENDGAAMKARLRSVEGPPEKPYAVEYEVVQDAGWTLVEGEKELPRSPE